MIGLIQQLFYLTALLFLVALELALRVIPLAMVVAGIFLGARACFNPSNPLPWFGAMLVATLLLLIAGWPSWTRELRMLRARKGRSS